MGAEEAGAAKPQEGTDSRYVASCFFELLHRDVPASKPLAKSLVPAQLAEQMHRTEFGQCSPMIPGKSTGHKYV